MKSLPVWFENSLMSPHEYDQGKETDIIEKVVDEDKDEDNYVDEFNYDVSGANIDILPILMGINKLSDSSHKIDKVLIRIWNTDTTSKSSLMLEYSQVWQFMICQSYFL